jgi:hypothetical protein
MINGAQANVLDFGADSTGVADSTSAITAAVSSFGSSGGNVYLPSGTYKVTDTITVPWNVNLCGDGSSNTIIQTAFSVTNKPVFTINGSTVSSVAHMNHRGITVNGNGNGIAFQLIQVGYAIFEDVWTYGFTLHWDLTDVLSSQWYSCRSLSGQQGLWARLGSVSVPNALGFYGCTFGSMNNVGLQLDHDSTLNYVGGSIEGCGTYPASGTNVALLLNQPGDNGASAAILSGVYLENNAGYGDVYIIANTTAAFPSTFTAIGCTFNRVSSSRYTTSNIFVTQGASDARIFVDVSGSAFQGYNTYVESSARPYIDTANVAGNFTLIENGALYGSTVAAPTYNTQAITPGTSINSSGTPLSTMCDDNIVQLSGYFHATGAVTSGAVIGTLVARHAPTRAIVVPAINTFNGNVSYLSINTSGQITFGQNLTSGYDCYIDNVCYRK